ncbi:Hypothetical protein R9X50_00762000 [Acrodontium crateriforme]|uniref:RNA helicase n=1 Tax=Acrodontium crateriforme TaxID=150365 RepID=A0AAQ3RCU6_9PEZI|nr:Hypothetical protein R9X50_00762000 [Acrodontium crateriforme]
MLQAARRRCVYCAFKSHQLALYARRTNSTTASFPLRKIQESAPRGRSIRLGREGNLKLKNGVAIRFTNKNKDGNFEQRVNKALETKLKELRDELKETPIIKDYQQGRVEQHRPDSFPRLWSNFEGMLLNPEIHSIPGKPHINCEHVRKDLKAKFRDFGVRGLEDRIKYHFYAYVTAMPASDMKYQEMVTDLRYPTEWFPATRQMTRTIHLHVGPTNSGKTYHALKRLETAQRGCYAGPLRLLAHEVYTRMTAKGMHCYLVTGDERREPEEKKSEDAALSGMRPRLFSCTVEMMPLNTELDVAVIDEIQMIGNQDRGWAWTQAVLGVKATEVHLCGEERTVPIIQQLCASVGEKLIIHRYERLSPLKMGKQSLKGNLRGLQKGDCIVSFSVMGIHALRKQIEDQTGRKVAIVYGSLPPETRAQQARLFNDPDNDYDFLVASDAVGMGLNLAIKRVIFETSNKFDGYRRLTLPVADIKQIGGRAGRYRTAAQASKTGPVYSDLTKGNDDNDSQISPSPTKADVQSVGYVTTLEDFDFPIVKTAMESEPEPIRTAGLFPPSAVLNRFASYFPPNTPFSYILTRLHEISQMNSRFHLCGLKDQIWVADMIECVPNLTISDRNIICAMPASKSDATVWKTLMPALARCIADQKGGDLYDIEEMPLEILEQEATPNREYLRKLETLHKALVGYLWLSFRFAGVFPTRPLALHVKSLVEERIEDVLGSLSFSDQQRRQVAKQRQKQLLADMEQLLAEEKLREGDAAGEQINAKLENAAREASQTATQFGFSVMPEYQRLIDAARRAGTNEQQTTITAGGDRFGGEDEMQLSEGLEDISSENGDHLSPLDSIDNGSEVRRKDSTTVG